MPADRYQQLINTPVGRIVSRQVGLPTPATLDRYERGQPVIDGPVLLGAAANGRLLDPLRAVLDSVGAEVRSRGGGPEETYKALVFDATEIADSAQLRDVWDFFHSSIRRVQRSGRVIVLATPPEDASEPAEAVAQRALEGLTRSIGKEVRRGATSQLVYVAPKAEDQLESTLRFLLSPKSAYVSGQVIRIAAAKPLEDRIDWERPQSGRVALVTGAARGIGESIAEVLARDGAHVVGLDVPAVEGELRAVTSRIGGSSLALDITAADAPEAIAAHLLEHHGGVDVVIHNAGVTRDKTLGRMSEDLWDTVIGINLIAPQRIDKELFARKVVRPGGRVVCVSSISGIAGNAGQTNYSTSKAGVIGIVQAFAPLVAKQGATINAVAPGFIETRMTAAMPLATREAGRRMNSLAQGGLPIDVAETIAWFASPGSGGVNGNVVRVCGQSLLGA
ncbi:MAG: 3-oxoacyl-ACP reductase [Solirubrobacterales bacterium]|nr:3-oxoacyl-ACP reductase [Solirubrobacterales bacterium]